MTAREAAFLAIGFLAALVGVLAVIVCAYLRAEWGGYR